MSPQLDCEEPVSLRVSCLNAYYSCSVNTSQMNEQWREKCGRVKQNNCLTGKKKKGLGGDERERDE